MATVPPVAHTWLAGDDATSTNMQTLTALLNFLRGGSATAAPTFRAILTSAGTTTIVNASTVTIPLNSVLEDSDASYNPTTGIYTVKTPGVWIVTGQVTYASNGAGVRLAVIQAAGTPSPFLANQEVSAAVDGNGRCGGILHTRFAAGDTFSLQGFQNSGAALGLNTTPTTGLPAVALQATWLSA